MKKTAKNMHLIKTNLSRMKPHKKMREPFVLDSFFIYLCDLCE